MANTIPAGLQRDLFLAAAMTAFADALTPLGLFSTVFRNVALEGTNKVQVPYYPLDTASAKDFAGTYTFTTGTVTSSKEITVNKRKYLDLSFTSEELARQPNLDPVKLGTLRGRKLAEDVLADIFSVVTAANFGAAAFTGAASDFDVDDVIDLETTVETAKWPITGRGLITLPAYIGGLKKDMNAGGGLATFGRDSNGSLRTFPMLNSFNVTSSNYIPANGENLKGFVTLPSAILIAFAPVPPAQELLDSGVRYEVMEDPNGSGIVMESRRWGDGDTDKAKHVLEVNYGYAVGEAAALKRIVSS